MKLYHVKGRVVIDYEDVNRIFLAETPEEAKDKARESEEGLYWEPSPQSDSLPEDKFHFSRADDTAVWPRLSAEGWLTDGFVAIEDQFCASSGKLELGFSIMNKLGLTGVHILPETLTDWVTIDPKIQFPTCICKYGIAVGGEFLVQFEHLGIDVHPFEGLGKEDPLALIKDGHLVGVVMPRVNPSLTWEKLQEELQ